MTSGAPCRASLGKEEAAEQRLDAEYLEKILGDVDVGEGLGIAVAHELDVVGRGEGEVAGDIFKGFVALEEFLPGVGGVGGGGPVAVEDLRADPEQARGIAGRASGRSMSVLTTLKTAMLVPMPSARMRMATKVKARSRRRVRRV